MSATGFQDYGSADFADEVDVSRETFADFQHWLTLLERWNAKINLVSPAAMAGFWHRHALDSWQVTRLLQGSDIQSPLNCLDLGSGAGFPGLAIGIALKQVGTGHVTLVESAGKKANFLRTVIRELDLPAKVWADRAEKLPPKPYDFISARAFAPLPRLLTYAQPFWGQDTKALLLKGQSAAEELTQAQKYWTFEYESQASRSDPQGEILTIWGLSENA